MQNSKYLQQRAMLPLLSTMIVFILLKPRPSVVYDCFLDTCKDANCEAQARVRQGLARDGSQGKRRQSFNPCLELTLKLVATFHHPPPISLILLN